RSSRTRKHPQSWGKGHLSRASVHGPRRDPSGAAGRHGNTDAETPMNPLLLGTAVEAVIKAGEIQTAFLASGFHVSKKGAIDLVSEADIAVETMFRKMIAERFPDHTILAEEFGQEASTQGASHCWVFDPIDGTNNYAHGLPIFCSSLALEIDGQAVIGA